MSNLLKNIFITFTFTILAFTVTNRLSAQTKYAKEYEMQGDKAMNKQDYAQAYDYYMLGRKFVKQNLTLMYKCGEAALKMKNYDKAEYWFQKVLIENDTVNINSAFPMLYLQLAESAICNGNIIQAQSFLNTCLLDCNDIEIRRQCKRELDRIDWIIENDTPQNYLIANLGREINDEASQFNTFILRDSLLIFTSPTYKSKYVNGQTYYTDIYNQIYYSFVDSDYFTRKKPLKWGSINKKKTDVADLFLDTVTHTAYFTYTKSKHNDKISTIYYSKFDDKTTKWSKPQIFAPLADDNHSYSHPVIARNGSQTLMYFASNRDGGYGKNDIWYIDMNDANAKPVNLGATVNTSGDEITPFYHTKTNTLYFSSDTHKGFGGFDIFAVEGWQTNWQEVKNMLMPINSPANDMYPYITDCDCTGYFTSNRPTSNNKDNKTCCNDLYKFVRYAPAKTNEPIRPAIVDIDTPARTVRKFDAAKDLPVALYFHNDSPDAGSELTTTETSYEFCYRLYSSLSNQYKANRTKGMNDEDAAAQLKDIDKFMTDKLQYGYNTLNLALDYILERLQQGKKITVRIKGYCSALYETEYNRRLAERRIVSVENYMRTYRGGLLAPYMDNKAEDGRPILETEHLAIGKLESTSPNPETLEEKRQSVYLPQSMEERRIEIKVVKERN